MPSRPFVAEWRSAISKTTKLDKHAKSVALHMAEFMDSSGYCFVSGAKLAHRSGLAESTVREAVWQLGRRGWVKVGKMRIRNGLGGSVNTYQAKFPDWWKNAPDVHSYTEPGF